MRTIVAVYDKLNDAYQTIEELRDAGIDRSHISLVTSDPEKEYAPYFQESGSERGEPVEGALAGGTIGGVAGLLLGLGALAIPGIGPVVAAGPLVSGLVGAGIGAAGGGLLGALVKAGVPEEEAGHYLEGIRRGGTLVAVSVMNYQAGDVVQILESNNPIDLGKRAESWREAGWIAFNPTEYAADDEYERAFRQHYDTRYAHHGRPYQTYAPAYYHGYQLAMDSQRQDRDWHEIEPDAERLWEEEQQGSWDHFKDAVQYGWEEVTASLAGEETFDNRQFEENDRQPHFYTHFDQAYAGRGYNYEHYAPAYRFGYLLADDVRYQNRPWEEIEPVVRERWERDHVGDRPWQEVKDAIRYAWQAAQ